MENDKWKMLLVPPPSRLRLPPFSAGGSDLLPVVDFLANHAQSIVTFRAR